MRGVESGMLQEIGRYLSSEGLSAGGMFILGIILCDEKARVRIENRKLRYLLLVPVVGYFIALVLNVVRIGITYTS